VYIQGNNQSVLYNTTLLDLTLKKKSQSIACHYKREGAARDEWRTSYVNTHDNDANILRKPLPAGDKRRGFVQNLLHYIFFPKHRQLEGVDGQGFLPTNHYDVWSRPWELNHKYDYDVWTRT
jgi:hypothetical protein